MTGARIVLLLLVGLVASGVVGTIARRPVPRPERRRRSAR
jgi:hypothetical protein